MKDTIIGIAVIIVLALVLAVMSGINISSECSRLEEERNENSEYHHDL